MFAVVAQLADCAFAEDPVSSEDSLLLVAFVVEPVAVVVVLVLVASTAPATAIEIEIVFSLKPVPFVRTLDGRRAVVKCGA